MQSIILGMVVFHRTFALLAAATALLASPSRAENANGSLTVSLQVLPRVRPSLPIGQRAAFVAAPGSAAVPCGTESSAACATAATAARTASGSAAPVVLTVLTDGAPTAIVER